MVLPRSLKIGALIVIIVLFGAFLLPSFAEEWIEKDNIRVKIWGITADGREVPIKSPNLLAIGVGPTREVIQWLVFQVQIMGTSPDYSNYNVMCEVPASDMTYFRVDFLGVPTDLKQKLQYGDLMNECTSPGGHRILPFDNAWYDLINTNVNHLADKGWKTDGGLWYLDMAWFNQWAIDNGYSVGDGFLVQVSYKVWWDVLEDPGFQHRVAERLPPLSLEFAIYITGGTASVSGQLSEW